MVDVLRSLTEGDVSPLVSKKPVLLASGRMACTPAWEQDLMEDRERFYEERAERMQEYGLRADRVISEALSRTEQAI